LKSEGPPALTKTCEILACHKALLSILGISHKDKGRSLGIKHSMMQCDIIHRLFLMYIIPLDGFAFFMILSNGKIKAKESFVIFVSFFILLNVSIFIHIHQIVALRFQECSSLSVQLNSESDRSVYYAMRIK